MIYLDNASTTIVSKDVLDTYNKVVETYFANPSSIHYEGQKSARLLQKAREQISSVFALPNHVAIFTSGATEANNLAIKGTCLRYQGRGKHIITTNVEHPSVLECFKQLEELFGFEVTYLPVNNKGVIELDALKSAIKDDTILVSIMAVNNEIGSINPIEDIGAYLKPLKKIVFHVDATQAIGKININYKDVDLISYAGHKIHGLNGCGVLLKSKNLELLPIISGGGQEFGLRSGTNDIALASSLSKATRLAFETQKNAYEKVSILYCYLKKYIEQESDLFELNSYDNRNPFILNFSSKTKKASVIVEALSNEGIMVSSTSACHSKNEVGSYVVKALGKEEKLFANTIRVSFDESNTLEEVEVFIKALDKIVRGIK